MRSVRLCASPRWFTKARISGSDTSHATISCTESRSSLRCLAKSVLAKCGAISQGRSSGRRYRTYPQSLPLLRTFGNCDTPHHRQSRPGVRMVELSSSSRKKSTRHRNRPVRCSLWGACGWMMMRSGADTSRSSPVSRFTKRTLPSNTCSTPHRPGARRVLLLQSGRNRVFREVERATAGSQSRWKSVGCHCTLLYKPSCDHADSSSLARSLICLAFACQSRRGVPGGRPGFPHQRE